MIEITVDGDTVFVFGTTIRACRECGTAVCGGPTICNDCANPRPTSQGIVIDEIPDAIKLPEACRTCGRPMRFRRGQYRCDRCRTTRVEVEATQDWVDAQAKCADCIRDQDCMLRPQSCDGPHHESDTHSVEPGALAASDLQEKEEDHQAFCPDGAHQWTPTARRGRSTCIRCGKVHVHEAQ